MYDSSHCSSWTDLRTLQRELVTAHLLPTIREPSIKEQIYLTDVNKPFLINNKLS